MEKQFCAYEISSKLKELGFEEKCLAGYYEEALEQGLLEALKLIKTN